jgi:glycosyltransferase involved in cell wall biosynthesis
MKLDEEAPVVFSLILATVDRVQELARLLHSIESQQMPGLELIVVDQNRDDRVKVLLDQTVHLTRYTHICSPRGLSRARNAGLAIAKGEIIGFPDDDSWFPEGVLPQIKAWFESHPAYHLLCCTLRDETGAEVAARWPGFSQPLDRNGILRAAVSASLFLRADAIRQIGGFDEQIGLGSETLFQSGEDTDLALRCLDAGGKAWFEKELHVCHPRREPAHVSSRRGFAYGMGFGYILGKHNYPPSLLGYHVARAIVGMIRSFLRAQIGEAAFYFQSARGRWKGYAISSRRARRLDRSSVPRRV